MLILGIKLKPGVDGGQFDSFLKKWIPVLDESRRIREAFVAEAVWECPYGDKAG